MQQKVTRGSAKSTASAKPSGMVVFERRYLMYILYYCVHSQLELQYASRKSFRSVRVSPKTVIKTVTKR